MRSIQMKMEMEDRKIPNEREIMSKEKTQELIKINARNLKYIV